MQDRITHPICGELLVKRRQMGDIGDRYLFIDAGFVTASSQRGAENKCRGALPGLSDIQSFISCEFSGGVGARQTDWHPISFVDFLIKYSRYYLTIQHYRIGR